MWLLVDSIPQIALPVARRSVSNLHQRENPILPSQYKAKYKTETMHHESPCNVIGSSQSPSVPRYNQLGSTRYILLKKKM
jgi:hypothetical protein